MDLFFDVETTGLPDFGRPSDDPAQPHLVQLAALLQEDDGAERASISLIIRPEGWEIPEGAAKVHGIDTATAARLGVPLTHATGIFLAFCQIASQHVAHNISFDRKVMRTALLRGGVARDVIEAAERPAFCTMNTATPIVNLPPTEKMLAAGFNKPKAPKLAECIKHFFGEDLVDAHDALVDVRACARIYRHLRSLEAQTAAA